MIGVYFIMFIYLNVVGAKNHSREPKVGIGIREIVANKRSSSVIGVVATYPENTILSVIKENAEKVLKIKIYCCHSLVIFNCLW